MDSMETTVRIAVDLLRDGSFDLLERLSVGDSLSAADMRWAVETYGRTLTVPPPEWWELATIVEVEDAVPARSHIAVPLWTVEEGHSDLSIELHLIEFMEGVFEVVVLNIEVL